MQCQGTRVSICYYLLRTTNLSLSLSTTVFRPKKSILVSGNRLVKFFYFLPARIVQIVSEYIFFGLKRKKRHGHTHKQKGKN